jgi:NAD(P)-dependent dehydrogenase (short-subunit alcohol dehydrogenase family)
MAAPILIFGASGGVGTALARRLTASGHPLHLAGRDEAKLADIARELDAPCTAGDVRLEDDLRRVAAAAGPQLSGLVFAVGSIDLGSLKRLEPKIFADAFALNVTAAAMAVRHTQAALETGGGSVVLFSSVAASAGFRNHAVTGTVKAAVEGLTRSLAADLAPRIRVNCVAPTLTRTPLAASFTGTQPLMESIARQHPLGRIAEAQDVAAVAAMLLSADGGFLTGQVIHVDGGRGTIAG